MSLRGDVGKPAATAASGPLGRLQVPEPRRPDDRAKAPGPTAAVAIGGLLVAVGTVSAHLIWFPAGVARAFPVQHAINVLAAVMLGPGPAIGIAVAIGVLRNLLGSGTPLAFPGAMVGAALAGLAFRRTGRIAAAVAGEVLGTGVLGALVAYPVARWVLGHEATAFFYVLPFSVSSAAGALTAAALLATLKRSGVWGSRWPSLPRTRPDTRCLQPMRPRRR